MYGMNLVGEIEANVEAGAAGTDRRGKAGRPNNNVKELTAEGGLISGARTA